MPSEAPGTPLRGFSTEVGGRQRFDADQGLMLAILGESRTTGALTLRLDFAEVLQSRLEGAWQWLNTECEDLPSVKYLTRSRPT